MKIQQLEHNGLEYKFLLTLDAQAMQSELDGTLNRIAANYKKPGFRPGKVPMSVIKKEFGEDIVKDFRNEKVNEGISKIIKENNIIPLRPAYYQEKENLTFEVYIEQTPTFDLKDIKDIKIQKMVAEITEEEVDQFTEKLSRLLGDFEEVNRAINADDFVDVSYTVRYKGNIVDELENVEDRIDLKAAGIDHIEVADHLVGLKKGDVKVIEKLGKRIKEELQDKQIEVTYEIKEVYVCTPHPINEAFLKRVKSQNLEEFKEKLRDTLQKSTSRMAYMHMKRQLLDRLTEQYDFEVPSNMVKEEVHTIKRKIDEERSLNPEFTEEITDEEVLTLSKRRIQLGILISRIAKEFNIKVKEEQVAFSMYMYAASLTNEPQKLMETWVKRPDFVAYFRAELLEMAVIDYLLNGATVDVENVSVKKLYQEASDFLMDHHELDGLIDFDEDEEDDFEDAEEVKDLQLESVDKAQQEEVSLVDEKKPRAKRTKKIEAE